MGRPFNVTAASASPTPPIGAAAVSPPHAADRGAAANPFPGTIQALANAPAPNGGAGLPANASNPFARRDLWQAFRFVGYFQRETVAVFTDSSAASDFCLANIGGEHGNGYFVASYRRAA